MHRSRVIAGVLILTVLAACSGGEEPDEVPPIGGGEDEQVAAEPEPEPEEVEEPVDVTVIPDEITEEYVEAVLAELERIRIEALAEFMRNDGELTIEFDDRLSSVFEVQYIGDMRETYRQMAEANFESIREPEDLEASEPDVVELLSGRDECIFVETETSADGVTIEPSGPTTLYYHLIPQERELVEDYNTTPWLIAGLGLDREAWEGRNPCDV